MLPRRNRRHAGPQPDGRRVRSEAGDRGQLDEPIGRVPVRQVGERLGREDQGQVAAPLEVGMIDWAAAPDDPGYARRRPTVGGRMPARGINHVDLAVRNVERSLAFYLEMLGPVGLKEYAGTLKSAARDPEATTVIDLVRRLFNLQERRSAKSGSGEND